PSGTGYPAGSHPQSSTPKSFPNGSCHPPASRLYRPATTRSPPTTRRSFLTDSPEECTATTPRPAQTKRSAESPRSEIHTVKRCRNPKHSKVRPESRCSPTSAPAIPPDTARSPSPSANSSGQAGPPRALAPTARRSAPFQFPPSSAFPDSLQRNVSPVYRRGLPAFRQIDFGQTPPGPAKSSSLSPD